MANAKLKTQITNVKVSDFLNSIEDQTRKSDAKIIDKLMQKISGKKAKMWGPSIIGYGIEHLKYESGRELDMPILAYSPRKPRLVLYVLNGGEERYSDLLENLGKHKTGKVCLYIKNLKEIDLQVLKKIIERSLEKKSDR